MREKTKNIVDKYFEVVRSRRDPYYIIESKTLHETKQAALIELQDIENAIESLIAEREKEAIIEACNSLEHQLREYDINKAIFDNFRFFINRDYKKNQERK